MSTARVRGYCAPHVSRLSSLASASTLRVMHATVEDFVRAFGRAPTWRVTAPGRVNLIGEHVDYHALPVLPFALARGVRVLARARDDERVRLVNVDPRHPPLDIAGDDALQETGAPSGWGRYVRALLARARVRIGPRGFDALVSSDLPEAAGLSSSSALTVALALCADAVVGSNTVRAELAALCASAERGAGVASGGMDQAVSLFARADHVLRIEFEPLRVHAIAWPARWRVVVADSGVRADKAGRVRAAYNALVADGEAALARLVTDPQVPHATPTWRELVRDVSAETIETIANERLELRLARCARHVANEHARVEAAVRALEQEDLARLGALLDASHASLRDELGVSCTELDALVVAARAAGASGARLTGAGFGGSMIAVTDDDHVERVVAALRSVAGSASRVFVARPSAAAACEPV